MEKKAGFVLTSCDGLSDDDTCISSSDNPIMNDTLCSKAYSDDMCHSSQDTLVVVTTEVNNNSNSIDGIHNSVSSKHDTNASKVKDILDSLSRDWLDGECTDKESTNSNVDVDVDINSNDININISRGKKLQELITTAIEAQNH